MNFLNNKLNQKIIYIFILSCTVSYFSLFAQIIPVTTTADTGSSSLRYAITNANNNDTIVFSGLTYPDTIRLLNGPINFNSIVTILGPGADSLSISGEDTSQIFSFGESGAIVHGLSFNNGYIFGNQNWQTGGAFNIGSADQLTLIDCIVSHNEARGDPSIPNSAGWGGAIYSNGQLNIIRTSIYNNISTGGHSTIGYGGAIYLAGGNCRIENSTISNNTSIGGPSLLLGRGGGIVLASGTLETYNCTITENNADDGQGGGIYVIGGTASPSNTIIAGNISGTDPDVSGNFASLGHNLILDNGSSSGWQGTDIIGVNPLLGNLRNNGGSTPTHALLPGSPAIDVGDTTVTDTLDQRGFPRIQDGNGDEIAVIDIGAYEAVVPEKPTNLTAIHGDREVNLTWQYANDLAITQYNIYRDASIVGNAPVGSTSFTDINLINGQTYIYNVTATDTIGFESSFSQPETATPNGPPRWSIPPGLFTFDEDDSLTVDLDSLLFDDSDPDDSLSISITSGSFVIISLNQTNHIARFSAPLNAFGLDSIIFSAFDPEGLTSSDTSIVKVNPVNDFPVMSPIPDSTILAYTDFNYQVNVNDLEGDSLRYFDNTNLFNIDSTGLIVFRPTLHDTGNYEIIVSAADNDTIVRDTFLLDIQLSEVISPLGLNVISLDQALTFSWTNPLNAFYSGTRTRIVMRKSAPITHPDSGIVELDTVFASPGNVSATIPNLDIADRYYFLIFNYFRENTDVILSGFVTGTDSTLSPQVSVDLSPRSFSVLNGAIYDTSIVISNNGGGTLKSKFNYNPTALQSSWFSIDSTEQSVGPFSSLNVPMRFDIPSNILDTLLSITISLETNQPGWQDQTIDINVNNVFDRFSPLVFIDSKPDSVVKQAAVKYEFTANDTMDSQIGDFPEQLFVRYALYNTITNQFVRAADGLHTNEIIFYPLTDGVYELSLWIYDRSGNGTALNEVAYIDTFIINASRKILPDRKWLLSSIPRDQNFTFPTTTSDSDFVIFRWNAREEEYNQILSRSIEPGFGYWIYSNKIASINVNSIPFETNNDSVVVPITRGWNQIGMPMPFDVEMSKVRFMQENASITSAISIIQAVSDSLIAPAIYWYRVIGIQSGYEWGSFDTTFAEPWRGYWIYSNTNGNLIYAKEPSFRNLSVSPSGMINNLADTWELNLSIDCENMIDSKNIIGTRIGKSIEIPEPPILDKYVSLYFKSSTKKLTGLYNSPLKDYTDVKSYDVFFETSEINKSHLIKWQLPENNVYFYLVDNYSEKIIDMREQKDFVVTPSIKTNGMILYATYNVDFKPSIIPVKFKLKQNYPNPFNPITNIEFGIPKNGKDNLTTLKIFNILGQEITTLVNRKINSGYHKITWNGLNKNNHKVASGLYFYSLSNGKTELFKKMIFIK